MAEIDESKMEVSQVMSDVTLDKIEVEETPSQIEANRKRELINEINAKSLDEVLLNDSNIDDPLKAFSMTDEKMSQDTKTDVYFDNDPYNEDETEERFLRSKPTCFVVFGKPGSGKTALAHRLALEWRCEIINSTELINQSMELDTELGQKCKAILVKGEELPEELVLKMIEDKINSSEVLHYGYVIDDFPTMCEDCLSIKDQLELLQNFSIVPDFIINIKISDEDLEMRRLGQRVDPITGMIYTQDQYNPPKPDKPVKKTDDEEEEDEEEEDVEEEEEEVLDELDAAVLERLRTRPEDLEKSVKNQIAKYKSNILRLLEDYMTDHDQEHLIEVDGNQNIDSLFKQVMIRLGCFSIRPAAVPIRLNDVEDEETLEDIETDDMMRMLVTKEMLSARFKWRRSRWMRNCPVALSAGHISPGKIEHSVAFLDKIYCLSSSEAMEKFIKNPRLYLLPPQPRPPCKFSVIGPPLSGKTRLAHLLAAKYNAKVINIDAILAPHIEREKLVYVDTVRKETTAKTLTAVITREKARIEAIHQKRRQQAEEAAMKNVLAIEVQQNEEDEAKDKDIKEDELTDELGVVENVESKSDTLPEAQSLQTAQSEELVMSEVVEEEETIEEEEITEEHPDVVSAAEAAVKQANQQSISLPVDMMTEIVYQYIQLLEKTIHERRDSQGPQHGGWILDNYPRTSEECGAMTERGLLPDNIVCLNDNPESNFLLKRWYTLNQDKIDEKIAKRVQNEQHKQAELEAARRQLEDEEKLFREKDRQDAMEEERERKLEMGEYISDDDGDEQKEEEGRKEDEGTKGDEKIKETKDETSLKMGSGAAQGSHMSETSIPSEQVETELKLPEGPEMEAFGESRRENDKELLNIQVLLAGSAANDVIQILIDDKACDDIHREAVNKIEGALRYQASEYMSADMDEEDDEMEADDEDEEEEEEEVLDSANRKKALGETNHFCPVALYDTGILYPGNPENSCKYREKIYYLSTSEAKEKFIEDPQLYMSNEKPLTPPPLRLLMLGSRGSGKSLHARKLAKKLGIFHISFKERLQEMLIHKMKKRIGPENEEDNVPEEEESGDEEDNEKSEGTEEKDDALTIETAAQEIEDEVEDEIVELTEDEEIIKQSLETEDPLIPEILDNIVPQWWNKEPFKSTGFILEGFPRNMEEARYMADVGLFPDAAVILQVEDTDVIARLLPPKMDKWRARRDRKLAKRKRKKDKALLKRKKAMEKRREELVKEREEKKLSRKDRDSEDDESKDGNDEEEEEGNEEEEEEDDIEAILAEEFEEEELEEEEEDELEDDAEDRMRNDLEEIYDNDTNRLAAISDVFEEATVPKVEIDGARRPHISYYLLNKQLKRFTDYRDSLFERVYSISEPLAKKMVHVGYKQPSVFGHWCPVKLQSGDCIQPMSGPGYPTFPCVYRQNIYFLSSRENRSLFMNNPLPYIRQAVPKPVVPIKLAIIGPPKSGKTSLARRFSHEYGVVRLSLGDAIRLAINSPRIHLAKQILLYITAGKIVPDELAIQAVSMALMEMQCQTRGYVLDGFPISMRQVELMTERHIIPVKVIELKVSSKEVMARGSQDRVALNRPYVMHDSSQILSMKLSACQEDMDAIRDWYQTEHMNYRVVEGEESKWRVWDEVLEKVTASVTHIQTYLKRVAKGKAASIADMCVTPSQFEKRMGDFKHYCPVCLATHNELVDNSATRSMKYAAEFRGHYYKMCDEGNLEQFLSTPECFVPPQAPSKLPASDMLPQKVIQDDLTQHVPEIWGYCPVTFLDGKFRYEALVPGSVEFMVNYRDKYYNMESEEKRDKFMRSPEKYCDLVLPHKLPHNKVPESLTSLPLLGYLEQGVCAALIKAMTAAGNFKPKYPFMTTSRSALIYIAYHLKAFNPRNSDYIRKKYKQKLGMFEESCSLITYLGDTMTVRYKDPPERPNDFDTKLDTFFALKHVTPTSTWIV